MVRRRTLEISFWAVAFAVGLYLLGFKVGGLIIPTIFLRFQARELWLTSLLYSLGVYVFFKIGLEEAPLVPAARRPDRLRPRPLLLRFLPGGPGPEPVPLVVSVAGFVHGRPVIAGPNRHSGLDPESRRNPSTASITRRRFPPQSWAI